MVVVYCKSNVVTRMLLTILRSPLTLILSFYPVSRCYPARLLLSTSFFFFVLLLRYSGHMMYNDEIIHFFLFLPAAAADFFIIYRFLRFFAFFVPLLHCLLSAAGLRLEISSRFCAYPCALRDGVSRPDLQRIRTLYGFY